MKKLAQARLQAEADLRQEVCRNFKMAREEFAPKQSSWVKKYPMFLTRQNISAIESGQLMPNLLFLTALCEDYGLSMDYFIRGKIQGLNDEWAESLLKLKDASRPSAAQILHRLRTSDQPEPEPPRRRRVSSPP